MKDSCTTCQSCGLGKWRFVPLLIMAAVLVIVAAQDAFAETEVTIPDEAALPSCVDNGSCFLPSEVTIGVGETISWVNDSVTIHTITSGNPADGFDGIFDSEIVMAGDTFSHTFTESGQFNYYCQIHPWMQGTVMVG